jgi:hypothetical protein
MFVIRALLGGAEACISFCEMLDVMYSNHFVFSYKFVICPLTGQRYTTVRGFAGSSAATTLAAVAIPSLRAATRNWRTASTRHSAGIPNPVLQ